MIFSDPSSKQIALQMRCNKHEKGCGSFPHEGKRTDVRTQAMLNLPNTTATGSVLLRTFLRLVVTVETKIKKNGRKGGSIAILHARGYVFMEVCHLSEPTFILSGFKLCPIHTCAFTGIDSSSDHWSLSFAACLKTDI